MARKANKQNKLIKYQFRLQSGKHNKFMNNPKKDI